ncbi:MAG: glycoside hydrolase family 57 protein [Elusimicrobiota bacterium]
MKPLYIAIVWHQHQPYYKNPETGEYLLPWVRLHCTKDYYDMVAILEKFPKIRQTFNITPSLMEQIIDYTNGATDDFLKISRKLTKELSKEDRVFILKNFFMCNPPTMIEPYPRYNELFQRRGHNVTDAYLKRIEPLFTISDIRDIVVWFNLCWIDPYFQHHNEGGEGGEGGEGWIIKNLFQKGKNFSEEEKQQFLDEALKIISLVLPKHKELQDKGQIEITTSPYYHPILPLIIDTNIARVAMPFVFLPKIKFQHPEDAVWQIKNGITFYEKIFGKKPKGFWPSEGSVSSEIIPAIAKYGINWIATDEEILFRTLRNINNHSKQELLYKPYRVKFGNASLNIIFRDHELSDLIGFVYHAIPPEKAADDFIERLHDIKNSLDTKGGNNEGNRQHLVSIILDGENCWEYYKNDGVDFLNALYTKLQNEEKNGILTTTVSEYLEKFPPNDNDELNGIFPGSWINGNFGIWIGHPEDNTAWEYLEKTRKFLINKSATLSTNILNAAWKEIYIAEGSDWNWWYGSDHSSVNDDEFDRLFRAHLMQVYKLLNEKREEIPDYLYLKIKRRWLEREDGERWEGGVKGGRGWGYPIDFIKPKIDGKVTSYFEWHNAGFYDVLNISSGAMHQTATCLKAIYWGFDETNLYFRLDCSYPYPRDVILKIIFLRPIPNTPSTPEKFIEIDPNSNVAYFNIIQLKDFTAGKKGIVELSVPFSELGTKTGDIVEFVVVTAQKSKDIELERWPYHSSIILKHPDKFFSEEHWSA